MVEWQFDTYTKDDDCPACDGCGSCSKKVPTGKKTFGENNCVKIEGNYFRLFEINRLFETAKKLNAEIKLINKKNLADGFTFEVGIVRILIMPLLNAYADDVVLTIE